MPASNRKAKAKEPVPALAPSGSGGRNKKSKGSMMWFWVLLGIAILAILAGALVGDVKLPPSPPPAKSEESKARDRVSGKKARDKIGKVATKAEDKGSTMHFLGLALRLQEMTQIATTLKDADEMTPKNAADIDVELVDIEDEIKAGQANKADASTARDLLSMVSVVRGTLIQHSQNLTDEEVEALNNSWTYANPRYWDDYYNKTSNEERFDWYGSWDNDLVPVSKNFPQGTKQMSDLLETYIKKGDKILMFGCGNSDMSEKMYRNGYENIVNIDISQSLLDGLKDRLQVEMPKMQWLMMSGADMSFADGEFDVILDKGTFDAIEQNGKLLQGSVQEAHRALNNNGVLISVTYNDADLRVQKHLRENAAWGACVQHTFERTGQATKRVYHVHACRK